MNINKKDFQEFQNQRFGKAKPIIGEIYHIFNRGVDKRIIFQDEQDKFRFIHDLYEFNDKKLVVSQNFLRRQKMTGVQHPSLPKENIVEILAWCLMDNHYHLLVREIEENGIILFMKKIGSGYTNYFNKKYKRSGALFQGRFKCVHIGQESQMQYIPYYIHLNPIEYFRKYNNNPDSLYQKLIQYRFSSLQDYLGIKNFPSIIIRDYLDKVIGKKENHIKNLNHFINL